MTPFKFGGGNGCQTDADTALVLMGYRYYDSRTGRFLTQDPAGDGDNWYAYADNSPTNEIDPGGLMSAPVPGNWNINGGDQTDFSWIVGHDEQDAISSFSTYTATVHLFLVRTDDYHNGQGRQVTGVWPLASWMFAGGPLQPGPGGSKYRYDMGEQPKPDMHIYHNGDPKGPETNINHEGKLRVGEHRGRILKEIPKKMKAAYRPIIKTFLERAGMAADAIEGVLDGLTLDIPVFSFYDPRLLYQKTDTRYQE